MTKKNETKKAAARACDICGEESDETWACPFCGRDVCENCAEWGHNGRRVVGCAACALDAETENEE